MLDFDEILVNIKNPQIQKYLEESIKSYRIGNYRSAILAVWVATMFDLVKKFETLVEQREPTAIDKWKKLKPKIEEHKNWEKELIQAAKAVDMLSSYEENTLVSLSITRNRYAHPSFNEVGSLFDPTPEEVRYFIRTLYDIVLSQPAQLGAFYVNNLLESIKNPTFFSSSLYIDELTELKNRVIEKVNRINSRQIPRLIKELFQALTSPINNEHELNIICFLVNIWGAKVELRLSDEISTSWNNYIINQKLNRKILEGILNYPECINSLSREAQEKVDSVFKSELLKPRRLSESAIKFLAASDIAPLAQSILDDVPSLISVDQVIERHSHYRDLFGDKFSELFGQDILNKTRQALKTCDGYKVRPILSILRDCNIWKQADSLASAEQEVFASELIFSLNHNNFETMNLLDFNNQEKIPIKWIKMLFEQWSKQLQDNSKIQQNLDVYLEYYLGLFKHYTDKLNDYSQSKEVLGFVHNYANRKLEDLKSNELLWTF